MQASFSDLEYDARKRLTRRDRFLAEIEAVTPWTLLVAELEPFYPKGEGRGRPPIGLEKMLRMYIAIAGGQPPDDCRDFIPWQMGETRLATLREGYQPRASE